MYPNILQSRGRVKGRHYPKRTISHTEEIVAPIEIVQEEVVNPLEYFTAQDLVTELRNRGYVVTCAREVITIETLWSWIQDTYCCWYS